MGAQDCHQSSFSSCKKKQTKSLVSLDFHKLREQTFLFTFGIKSEKVHTLDP